jgi:hypothetical protein
MGFATTTKLVAMRNRTPPMSGHPDVPMETHKRKPATGSDAKGKESTAIWTAAVMATLWEWASDADDEAFRDL